MSRRCAIRLVTIFGFSLLAIHAYGETHKPHSFADWSLPDCRACDLALIRKNMGTGRRAGWGRLTVQSEDESRRSPRFGGMSGVPSLDDSSDSGIRRTPQLRAVTLWARADVKEFAGSPDKQENRNDSSQSSGSPGHIFWVIPAFKVDYGTNFKPLTPKEKFGEWAQSEYDPLGLGAGAVEAATLEHSSTDGFCGYGHGWGGYGECFGSLQLDAADSSFIGDFVLPVLMHQDPRYFRLGGSSIGKRIWYAVSRVFVTYNDAGHTVFFTSALSGTAIAAGLSNFYYPAQDVGLGHTMTRIAIDLGNTALYNLAAEFWPDIHRKLRHTF